MDKIALQRLRDLLWFLVMAGLVAASVRFTRGLGATTGLNDAAPWGLWIAVKLGFVALAGGGFTLAGLVYVFRLESLRPMLRRAILIALLGYASFIVSLLFDLGLPWHIYMPILNWQHHSVMFEIAWCVMLYFSVLGLEFMPVILEHPWFARPFFKNIYHLLHRATIPLVIAGIVLSTLHQSSLGALFLIMPHRVHPLWYSAWIPVLFFTSAIAAGLFALIVESFVAQRLFSSRLRLSLLGRLGNAGAWVLWVYLGIRLGDLVVRGVLPAGLDGSWQSLIFVGEIVIGGMLPAMLLLLPGVRANRYGLLTCAILGIFGVLSQRMSLSMFTQWRPPGAPYFPSAFEIIIALAIPAAAGLVYLLFAENLPVLSHAPERQYSAPGLQHAAGARPSQYGSLFQRNRAHGLQRSSGLAVVAIALTAAFAPARSIQGAQLPTSPVSPARGWESLAIDGNRRDRLVIFPHTDHQQRLANELGERACQVCHHLDLPGDRATACSACHQENDSPTRIFDHTLHTRQLGGNAACQQCHLGEHRAQTAAACAACHENMSSMAGEKPFQYFAPSYQQALHGRCLACHQERQAAADIPDLASCSVCHFKPAELQRSNAPHHQ